jgi:hypothetical protein
MKAAWLVGGSRSHVPNVVLCVITPLSVVNAISGRDYSCGKYLTAVFCRCVARSVIGIINTSIHRSHEMARKEEERIAHAKRPREWRPGADDHQGLACSEFTRHLAMHEVLHAMLLPQTPPIHVPPAYYNTLRPLC